MGSCCLHLPAHGDQVVMGTKGVRGGWDRVTAGGRARGPDSGCIIKAELLGFADRLDERGKERDPHTQMRKPGHRS